MKDWNCRGEAWPLESASECSGFRRWSSSGLAQDVGFRRSRSLESMSRIVQVFVLEKKLFVHKQTDMLY